MKKTIAFVWFVYVTFSVVLAQDIITLTSGQEMKARIIRLNLNNITCIPENNTDTISLPRTEIARLQYRSGILIYLSEIEVPAVDTPNQETGHDSLFSKGERDANIYYKGYKAAATGTLLCSLYFPFGLIPAIACSATPPTKSKLGYRDQKLMENDSYYKGYTRQAHKIKKKKVWQGFAIGSGAMIGLYLVLGILAVSSY